MTTRPRRTPSANGFKGIASPADIPSTLVGSKKKLISKVKEKAVDILTSTTLVSSTLVSSTIPSPVPKDFVFLSEIKTEDFSGKLSKIQNSPYPTCCGAQIIHGFSAIAIMTDYKAKVAIIAAQVRLAEISKIGMLTAIINHTQKKLGMNKVLEECGFNLVSCTSNPNHDDTTTIYLYVKLIGNKDLALDGTAKKKNIAA